MGYRQNCQKIRKKKIPILDGRAGHLAPIQDTQQKSESQKRSEAFEDDGKSRN